MDIRSVLFCKGLCGIHIQLGLCFSFWVSFVKIQQLLDLICYVPQDPYDCNNSHIQEMLVFHVLRSWWNQENQVGYHRSWWIRCNPVLQRKNCRTVRLGRAIVWPSQVWWILRKGGVKMKPKTRTKFEMKDGKLYLIADVKKEVKKNENRI